MGLDDIDEIDPPFKTKQVVSAHAQAKAGGTIAGGSGGGSKVLDLGELFGGPVVSNSVSAVASQRGGGDSGVGVQHMAGSAEVLCHFNTATSSLLACDKKNPQQNVTGQFDDFLDSFFTQPSSAKESVLCKAQEEEEQVGDLLDLSKPAEQVKCSDARSFLEAFENQSKGHPAVKRNGFSLADLTKGFSNNLVKARLLKLMNNYDLLGVSRDATPKEIRQHYKMRTLELHPDRVGRDQTPEEAELFKRITTAHDILTDPEKRAKYDEELRQSEKEVGNSGHWFDYLGQE